jgi:L-ascorbate metabolism protein UlaG (beta-lactamase superfamily)
VLATEGEVGITFIGHSGFFIQIAGKNVLVDPNFARWLFILKRLRRPGLRIRQLPKIDYVLVTHAHFDHLHRPSLRRIARGTRRLTGQSPKIIIPTGVRDLVETLGFSEIIELNWWEAYEDGEFLVTHVPAEHWGARMIHDTHRGFGGYVLHSKEQSIYHAGDTAYFNGFSEIGQKLNPEIALLPIGAYHPESFRAVHTSPEDAMQAFHDLGSEWLIPMHYGTFKLSHEPMNEPVERLMEAAQKANVSDRVLVLDEGVPEFFK